MPSGNDFESVTYNALREARDGSRRRAARADSCRMPKDLRSNATAWLARCQGKTSYKSTRTLRDGSGGPDPGIPVASLMPARYLKDAKTWHRTGLPLPWRMVP